MDLIPGLNRETTELLCRPLVNTFAVLLLRCCGISKLQLATFKRCVYIVHV